MLACGVKAGLIIEKTEPEVDQEVAQEIESTEIPAGTIIAGRCGCRGEWHLW